MSFICKFWLHVPIVALTLVAESSDCRGRAIAVRSVFDDVTLSVRPAPQP